MIPIVIIHSTTALHRIEKGRAGGERSALRLLIDGPRLPARLGVIDDPRRREVEGEIWQAEETPGSTGCSQCSTAGEPRTRWYTGVMFEDVGTVSDQGSRS